jgi:hypothetical protein
VTHVDITMPTPVVPKCDFCSQRPVRWSYPARDFIRKTKIGPHALETGSRGGWAACQECHEIIQRADRGALAKRSARMLPQFGVLGRQERRRAERELRAIHDDFWRSREGAPVEVTDP